MTKINTKFTEGQVSRLKTCVKKNNWIHKDLRKKLYYCTKINLKIGYGLSDTLKHEIEKIIDFDVNLNLCFPSDELSLDVYKDFMGSSYPDYDEDLDHEGYKNTILFLQYLIDKL